jgi:hypothetical protein
MQPTTLNKVISLFLVGGLVFLVLAFILWDVNGPPRLPNGTADLMKQVGPAFLAVIGGLLVVSLATVLGVACEAFTDLTVRKILKAKAKNSGFAAFFGQGKLLKDHEYWRSVFNSSVSKHERLANSLPGYREHSLAVGLFYTSANNHAIEWVQSHYATYVLATNLAFISLVLEVYILIGVSLDLYSWATALIVTCVLLPLAYSFFSHAMDRYLYSYQFPMRHGAVTLLMNGVGDSGEAHDTAAPTDQKAPLSGR